MGKVAPYDGLADAYETFVGENADYYEISTAMLRRLLGAGPGRCLDLGCGGGLHLGVAVELGWEVLGVDVSSDQLRIARRRFPAVELIHADAATLPFPNGSFDAAYSMFTHTDADDFAAVTSEALRVLKQDGRFVYVGNHPCFVGPAQLHLDTGVPRLFDGYRRGGRWQAADAPGTTPGGWRERLGSFVHIPLGDFLSAFAGFELAQVGEPEDGRAYPTMIALAFVKP
jgi:SAM-dependent methyltransferase